MYETSEFYAVEGNNLKDLLKGCIYNYYIKNKDKISKEKGENNVQTV